MGGLKGTSCNNEMKVSSESDETGNISMENCAVGMDSNSPGESYVGIDTSSSLVENCIGMDSNSPVEQIVSSPIQCPAGSSGNKDGNSIDLMDRGKAPEEVKDELESEQVDDDNEGGGCQSPLKDAFELVDEFSDTRDYSEEVNPESNYNNPLNIDDQENVNSDKDLDEIPESDPVVEGTHVSDPVVVETPESDIGVEGAPESDLGVEETNPLDLGSISDEDPVHTELFENCDDLSSIEETANIDEVDESITEDPLMQDNQKEDSERNSGKRKNLESEETGVRKSSRIRSKHDLLASPGESPKKQKMLQKPEERPSQKGGDESDGEVGDGALEEETNDNTVGGGGDPSREPGADAERRIDQDLLFPFRFGWKRECVIREVKSGPPQVDVFYWPPKDGNDYGGRNREARRKRRSKVDHERYFEEFPHNLLSVNNFSYVRRVLGLNNEAYEMVRHAKAGLETRSDKHRRATKKVTNYKEIAEHEGLLSGSSASESESDAGIEEITEFDIGIPLCLQVNAKVTPYREEYKKRRKWPDKDRCVTPPLASDMPWTFLDDDPLGVYTELSSELTKSGSPPTPPPLRAVRLTCHTTATSINDKLDKIKSSLPDPLTRIRASNTDLEGSDQLASHDLAVRKFKNYRGPSGPSNEAWRPPGAPGARRPVQPSQRQQQGGVHPSRVSPGVQRVNQPPSAQGFVKVKLPMPSTNGKRPVVELVMLTNSKYQPIKFTNNRQVTESIPKRLFDQANLMRKTLYQRSVQVPKIGTKQVFLAINPTPGGVRPYTTTPTKSGPPAPGHQPRPPSGLSNQPRPPGGQSKPSPRPPLGMTRPQGLQPRVQSPNDQVSILVRPAAGGNAVLLNVPRSVALKVKVGTTLSFSASNDQKYTVMDNKMHPPVGRQKPTPSRLPSLPSGVSIRPVAPGTIANARKTFPPRHSLVQQRKPSVTAVRPPPSVSKTDLMNFTPCSPFCPGVSGIPELECIQCHSLFHPKCVNIPSWQVHNISDKFKCRRCSSGGSTEVIDLD